MVTPRKFAWRGKDLENWGILKLAATWLVAKPSHLK